MGALLLLAGPLAIEALAQETPAPPPSISGNPWVGQTLTLQQGTWGAGDSVSDQWQDCDASLDTCSPIENATGGTYTVTASDLGYVIHVAETATAPDSTTTIAWSNATPTVAPPSNQTPPAISGTPEQGETLTASTGQWTNEPTSYTYQWEDCNSAGAGCAPIGGATGPTYTVGASDTGSTFVVQETAFDETTASAPANSSPTAVAETGSSVQLVSSHSSAVVNQSVELAATVTAQSNTTAPAGSMTFTNGATAIPGCANVAVTAAGQSQTVLCSAAFPAGTVHLAAVFTPGAGSLVLGSTSPTVTLPVTRDPTHLALRVAKQAMAGTRLTYTATLSVPAESGHALAPTGTIAFLDHGKAISGCTSQRMTKLVATCVTTYVLPGQHTITAVYRPDANFAGTTSSGSSLTVTPIPVIGEVTSTLNWTFYFTPAYTNVVHLILQGIQSGSSVQVGCHGHGCPFASRRLAVPRAAPCTGAHAANCPTSSMSLTSSLAGRRLGVGAQITVMVAHANYVGKYYSFTVRPRAQPRVRIACLAPDSPIPGADCSFGATASGAG